MPPHLNHIGDDLSRGLLKFAEAKPLGERGLRWLKIHLANLYGFDKANFDERVEFVHEHLDDIYDSAMNPLAVSFFTISFRKLSSPRDDSGGNKPRTLGNASRLASNSAPLLNRLTHSCSSLPSLYTRTGPATVCSTMLPLGVMIAVRDRSI